MPPDKTYEAGNRYSRIRRHGAPRSRDVDIHNTNGLPVFDRGRRNEKREGKPYSDKHKG
jgi:hypothetical protein